MRESSVQLRAADLDFDIDDDPTIGDLEVDGFTVVDAHKLGDGEVLARLQTRADVLLEVVVWRGDYVDAEHAHVTVDASRIPESGAVKVRDNAAISGGATLATEKSPLTADGRSRDRTGDLALVRRAL